MSVVKSLRPSAAEEADLDRIMEDPRFQQFADDSMDAEFAGEGLSDLPADLEANRRYLIESRIALHVSATRMLEPGEPLLPAYSIAREFVADQWQQIVLIEELRVRYHDALLEGNSAVASRIYFAIANAKYGQHRQNFSQRRAAAKVG